MPTIVLIIRYFHIQSFESDSETEDELWDVKVGTWVEAKFHDAGALDDDSGDEFDNLCCEICGSGADDVSTLA